ncbi:MAG: hypothetical protein B7X99_11010 [Rhizobiales bacterium 17-65-6]|nr:MAG: hypothetical protein B7Z30_00090 [Rhizobiales bacterium 12-68-15]OYX90579.1 MAG: hypothetical protein B7Y84_00510 [Azorhizobium sp. 32-67-21]OYZ98582.1 MAG: hypothetical protein B7X99_11010 [Rhizobiales bacterium 17-65-6]
MKKATTSAGVVPAAIVDEAWQEVGASFDRFCLTAGLATLAAMMDEDALSLAAMASACGVFEGDGRFHRIPVRGSDAGAVSRAGCVTARAR